MLSFLLARSIRLENEQKRRLQEAEMRRQETLRHHLSDWRVYLQAGDVMNVSRYVWRALTSQQHWRGRRDGACGEVAG